MMCGIRLHYEYNYVQQSVLYNYTFMCALYINIIIIIHKAVIIIIIILL